MNNSVESNAAFVSFKIQPKIIPDTDIQRSGDFPAVIGGFGNIWKCYMSTQSGARRLVAVKCVDMSYREPLHKVAKGIRREAYVRMQLLHDNILPLEGVIVANTFGPFPAFVSPWMENGALDHYLNREVGLSWERKLNMVRDVAAGLQYLHDKDIVHGDLTPTNILVSEDGRLCIADYGLSIILAESDNTTFNSYHGGNVQWMAPEIITQEESTPSKPTKAGDVYSYGCVMMQVFSGCQPYYPLVNSLHVVRAIVTGREPFRQLVGINEEFKQFAQLCLSKSMEHRPLVAKIVEFLWSQTDITEAMKTMLPQLPVTVTQISPTVLTKCDYPHDGLNVLGEALKYKWVVHGSNEIEVAVKTLRDDVNSQNDINKIFNRIRREMYVREKLRHETILALYGMTEGFGILPSFVYPWMAGGSLHDYVKRECLSPSRKLDILLDVTQGIEYLHKQDVVHGSLTGDNVLLDESGRVRIADFSHSLILAEADSRMFSEQLPGDVRYTAPESIPTGGQTGAPKPTKGGDVYSYGCVAILVLSGKVPYWWISEESQILSEKEMGTWPSRPALEIDEVHLNLVQQCLSTEKSRPSIGKVLYLILVQSSGATDLTTLVKRLNKTHQNNGSFGNVHTCKLNLGDTIQQVVFRYQSHSMSNCVDVAVKEINVTSSADMLKFAKRLFREIKIWLELEHENIVPLWGVAYGFGSLPALISPWLKNGALTKYLEREHAILSYSRRFSLLKDIARGLQYLHSRSIIHGDLSGNNVLVDKDGKASLTDFGLSALLPERRSQALVPTNPGGTPNYMAPECLMFDDEDNESPKMYPKSDVYSFGGIMLHVLEGKVPYHYIRNQYVLMNAISNGTKPKRPLAPGPVVEDNDWNFIESCWQKDMKCRPSDEDILKFVEGKG